MQKPNLTFAHIINVTFGYIPQNFLDNNAGYAVMFAGVLLSLAALATLLIKSEKTKGRDYYFSIHYH